VVDPTNVHLGSESQAHLTIEKMAIMTREGK
jgi:hypothetical protein